MNDYVEMNKFEDEPDIVKQKDVDNKMKQILNTTILSLTEQNNFVKQKIVKISILSAKDGRVFKQVRQMIKELLPDKQIRYFLQEDDPGAFKEL